MSYDPPSGSIVSFQSDPTKLVGTVSVVGNVGQVGTVVSSLVNIVPSSVIVGASVFGLAPVNVVNFGASIFGTVSVMGGPVSVIGTMSVLGTVPVTQSGTWISSVQIITGVGVIGSVTTLQGTNPWLVNHTGNGSILTVGKRSSVATITSLTSNTVSAVLKAPNADRANLIVVNDSTAILFMKYGTSVTSTDYSYKLQPGDTWEIPQPAWNGTVDAIWSSMQGVARVTETTTP